MRRSLVVCFLLLSFLLLHQVKGIRLKNEFLQVERQSIHGKELDKSPLIKINNGRFGEVIRCKRGHCRGALKIIRSVSKKSSHQKLPSIHEDYYGPRHHKPKHH